MPTDNEMRTLIALGAFSSVQGGGGDIPDDLQVNSVTACGMHAGCLWVSASADFDQPIRAAGGIYVLCRSSMFTTGPIVMADDCLPCHPIHLLAQGGEIYAGENGNNLDRLTLVGTRQLENGITMRGGRYYYHNTACGQQRDFDSISVDANATAEIWLETGGAAVTDFTLPSGWKWVGDTLPNTLETHHFYDITARNINGLATVANVAFDIPLS